MNYANWASLEDVKKNLKKVDLKGEVEKSGVPVAYDENALYINDNEGHTLVVGAEGSGKTQIVILPVINLAMKANESMLINDVKGSSNGITDKSELRKNLIRTAYKGLRSGINTKNNIVSGLVGLLGAGLGSGLGYMLGKNNKVPMAIGGGVLGGSLAGYLTKKSLGTPEDALRDKLISDNIKALGKKMSQSDKEVRQAIASLWLQSSLIN